jgi:hypothetical protein
MLLDWEVLDWKVLGRDYDLQCTEPLDVPQNSSRATTIVSIRPKKREVVITQPNKPETTEQHHAGMEPLLDPHEQYTSFILNPSRGSSPTSKLNTEIG